MERGVSRYAGGGTLVATTSAFLALAAALGVTALRLHSTLFEVASVAMIAVAATPKPLDSNGGLNGAIHTAAAFVYFVAAAAGAVSSSPGQPRAGVAYLLVIVTAVFNVSIFDAVGLRKTSGLYQRLCFALVVLWIMLPG